MHLLRRIHSTPLAVTHKRNQLTFIHNGRHFYQSLYAAIRLAKSFMLIEFYIIRNDQTGDAFAALLAEAVRRGVRVMLIYDYIGCIDTPANYFSNMARQGIELMPFNVPSFRRGLRWFDRRDHRNFEINLIIDDEAFGAQIQSTLLKDFHDSRQILLADHKTREIFTRALEKITNIVGWFL